MVHLATYSVYIAIRLGPQDTSFLSSAANANQTTANSGN